MKLTDKRAWMALLLMPVFFYCATYNQSMQAYYDNMRTGQYDKALEKLESNNLIKKDRNKLLYMLEAGRIYRLKNDFVTSNIYFNQADQFIESTSKSASDLLVGNLVNPMHQVYRGEDFEQFMLHYYKALNYSALGQPDEAVVEARRISLSTTAQSDKFANKENRYSKDAFSLNLQGMIYEMAGDMNNAFIAYRNAADLYLAAGNSYYGVSLPAQLQQDLLRSAAAMGFTEEQARYEKLFKVSLQKTTAGAGELILFMEEGQAPVKEERSYMLSNAGTGGFFNFTDEYGYHSSLPFNHHDYHISDTKLSSIRTMRVAVPTYRVNYPNPASKSISVNGNVYTPQVAQNLNSVAVSILKERFLTELANALARQLTKKLVEKGTQAAAESIAKKKDSDDDKDSDAEKEKKRKKREENAKAVGEAAGFVMNMINTVTEKADTRNWQSLPAFISYVRIPLAAGENTITLQQNGVSKTITVTAGKGLQLMGTSVN